MSLSLISVVSLASVTAATAAAPKLEIEGTPKVAATGNKGSDGSPELAITITFKTPIPTGYTKAKMEVCTDRCYAGAPAIEVPAGAKSITLKGYFHHSVDGKNEYAWVKINNPTTGNTIEFKLAVKIPGDF